MNQPVFPNNIPCQCYPFREQPCVCPNEERALRAYSKRNCGMTLEQREWCLRQIDDVEGYDRREYENKADDLIASGVLEAWADYCRDKGLL